MKRREIIFASAALIGGVLPRWARAQAAPCPPPTLSEGGGTPVTTPCGPGSAPAWFLNQAERTWVAVAGGGGMAQAWQRGSRIVDVSPNPLPPGNDGINAVHNNWTGGCANQALGEYYLPAQGGHNGYYGNEIYALALREETPTWRRIWGPTPNAQILSNDRGYNPPSTSHADGNPRPTHGWFTPQCSNNGRIWLVGSPAYANPAGTWGTSVYSIDRNNLTAGWMYHGRLWTTVPGGSPGSSFGFQSGPAAYDRVGNRMYSAAEFATNDAIAYFDVAAVVGAGPQSQTSGPAVPGRVIVNEAYTGLADAWSVVVHDVNPRVWVIGRTSAARLWLLDPTNTGAGFQERATSGTGSWAGGCGAVYHAGHRAIYVAGVETGATVRRLAVPANPMSGSWVWSTLSNAGGVTPSGGFQYNGTFSKLQMIEDMGNGRSALVLMSNVSAGTYMYKLPAS